MKNQPTTPNATLINPANIVFYYKQWFIVFAICLLLKTSTFAQVNFFSCSINNKVAQISWQTTSENNTSYFEVEKSSNGIDFITVATITAVGKLNSTTNYIQRDELLLFLGIKVYYRLKIVDQNLKTINTQTIAVTIASKSIENIKTWPMPFANQLNVSFYSNENLNATIKIVDVTGKIFNCNNFNIKKGQNNILLNQVQKLLPGIYVLMVYYGNNQVQSIKIIKQ